MMTPAAVRHRSAGPTEHVADAADRVDERRVRRIALDLAAEPVDMDIDCARLAGVVVPPDALEQLVAGEDLPGMADEEGEELEGFGLHRDDLAVAEQPVAAEVRLDRSKVDDRRRPIDRDGLVRAPEDR